MPFLPQQASSAAGAASRSSPRRTLSPCPPQPPNVNPQSRLLMGDLSQRRSPWARSLPAPNQPACPAPHTDHTPPALTAPTRCGAAPHRVLAPAACRSGNWAAPFPRLPTATRIERGGGRPCQLGTGTGDAVGPLLPGIPGGTIRLCQCPRTGEAVAESSGAHPNHTMAPILCGKNTTTDLCFRPQHQDERIKMIYRIIYMYTKDTNVLLLIVRYRLNAANKSNH